jgi:hypothetical protein
MNGIIEEAGCLARGVMFASMLCVTRYTFSKAGFVTLAERRALQKIQMETTLLLGTCTEEAFTETYKRYCQYLGQKRQELLKGMWDSLEEPRVVVFRRALSPEYRPYVLKYLSDNAEAAVELLRKHELEPCEHLESLKDSWAHNMYQEKIFGAQSEVQRSSRGGIQRTRGHALALVNGNPPPPTHILTPSLLLVHHTHMTPPLSTPPQGPFQQTFSSTRGGKQSFYR